MKKITNFDDTKITNFDDAVDFLKNYHKYYKNSLPISELWRIESNNVFDFSDEEDDIMTAILKKLALNCTEQKLKTLLKDANIVFDICDNMRRHGCNSSCSYLVTLLDIIKTELISKKGKIFRRINEMKERTYKISFEIHNLNNYVKSIILA